MIMRVPYNLAIIARLSISILSNNGYEVRIRCSETERIILIIFIIKYFQIAIFVFFFFKKKVFNLIFSRRRIIFSFFGAAVYSII